MLTPYRHNKIRIWHLVPLNRGRCNLWLTCLNTFLKWNTLIKLSLVYAQSSALTCFFFKYLKGCLINSLWNSQTRTSSLLHSHPVTPVDTEISVASLFSITSLPFQPFYHHINILTHISFWMALNTTPSRTQKQSKWRRTFSTFHHCWGLSHVTLMRHVHMSTCGVWGRSAEGRSLSTDNLKTRANICDSLLLLFEALLFFSCALRPSSLSLRLHASHCYHWQIAPRGTGWLTSVPQ